jgi:hypothetical protein
MDIPHIAVIGGRDFNDYGLLEEYLLPHIPFILVSGGAQGADSLAEQFADNYGLLKIIIKSDWDKHGKSAGFIRNYSIIDESEKVIAFWDLYSKGTKHSLDYANKLNKRSIIIVYNGVKYAHTL